MTRLNHMKTVRVAIVCVLNLLVTTITWGQSSFWLYNTPVDAPVFDAEGNPLTGLDYLVELWGGTDSGSLSPALTYYTSQRVRIPFLDGAGFFRDGYEGRGSTDDLVISGAPSGGRAWLQVRAWDARLGDTYEEVQALGIGGYGESSLFFAEGGVPGLLLPDPPGLLLGLEPFSLLPIIPEPSTSALGALGAAALWWARRRSLRG